MSPKKKQAQEEIIEETIEDEVIAPPIPEHKISLYTDTAMSRVKRIMLNGRVFAESTFLAHSGLVNRLLNDYGHQDAEAFILHLQDYLSRPSGTSPRQPHHKK